MWQQLIGLRKKTSTVPGKLVYTVSSEAYKWAGDTSREDNGKPEPKEKDRLRVMDYVSGKRKGPAKYPAQLKKYIQF